MLRKIREKVSDAALKRYRQEMEDRRVLAEKEANRILKTYRKSLNSASPNPMSIDFLHQEWVSLKKEEAVWKLALWRYDEHLKM